MTQKPTEVVIRRRRLTDWLQVESLKGALTAQEIVDRSGLYEGHGRYDRCFDDLKALQRSERVERLLGRPAKWIA